MKSNNLTLLLKLQLPTVYLLFNILVSFYYHNNYFKEHFSVPVAPGTELHNNNKGSENTKT